MRRFVLLHRGRSPDAADIEAIACIGGVTVIAHEAPHALLVESTDEGLAELRRRLESWTVAEEIEYPPPQEARED
jgi:hypothetical protein